MSIALSREGVSLHSVRNYLILAILAVTATAWRIYNAETFLAPGVELITLLSVASALLLPRVAAIVLPLGVVFVGDLILGGAGLSSAFVWAAWAIIAVVALLARRLHSTKAMVLGGAGLGAAGSTLFFLISNFGVWVHGLSGGWSAPGFDGLVATYVMGLPFYLTPLAFNLALVPLAVTAVDWIGERSTAPALPAPATA